MATKQNKREAIFKLSDCEDLATINAIKQGNKEAYEKIYKKYYRIILRHVEKSLYGTFHKDEAQDLTQDIMIKTYENISKYEKQYTFNSWLTALTNNTIIDYVRKNKKIAIGKVPLDKMMTTEESDVKFELPDVHQPNAMESTESIEKAKCFEIIFREVEKLKLVERQIMELYYIDNLSYQQICDKLHIKLSYMKLKLKRAKEKIKSSLNMNNATIEIAWSYSMEHLDVESIYKLNKEGESQ